MDAGDGDEVGEDGLRKSEENKTVENKSESSNSEEVKSEDNEEDQEEVDEMAKSVPRLWDRIRQSIDWQSRLRRCLLLAALACILRPTNVLIWICFACFAVLRIVTRAKMLSLPWEGMQIWVQLTFPVLLPPTKKERLTLLREVIFCGYGTTKPTRVGNTADFLHPGPSFCCSQPSSTDFTTSNGPSRHSASYTSISPNPLQYFTAVIIGIIMFPKDTPCC